MTTNSALAKPHAGFILFMRDDDSITTLKRVPSVATAIAATMRAKAACLIVLIGHVPGIAAEPTDVSGIGFGGAVPNERFVHEFQRQVVHQL